jgi:hypothetical protein
MFTIKERQELERELQEQLKEVQLQAKAQAEKELREKKALARANDAREKLNEEKYSLQRYVFQNQRLVRQKYWSRGPMQLSPFNVINHYFPPAPSYFHQTNPSKMEQPATSSSWIKESKHGDWGFDKPNQNLVKVVIDLRPKKSPTRFEPLTGGDMTPFINAYVEAMVSDPSYVRRLKIIDTNSE